jgi:hypothetical protein
MAGSGPKQPIDGDPPTGAPEGEAENSPIVNFAEEQRRRGREPFERSAVETGGDGGDPPDGSNVRIAILETQVAHIQSALGDIRTDLREVLGKLGHLPTKQDLSQNIATIVVIGLAVIAIVIGGIIGGLALLQPKEPPAAISAAPAPQPIVIQLPPQTAPPQGQAAAPAKGKGKGG